MKIKEFLGLKKKSKLLPFLKNQKGQFAIEAVLLMTVLMGLFIMVTRKVQKDGMLSKLFSGPIENVATMTAYGTWKKDGCTAPGKQKQTIGKCHPNSIARSLSSSPVQ
jgi:hypothetical protein